MAMNAIRKVRRTGWSSNQRDGANIKDSVLRSRERVTHIETLSRSPEERMDKVRDAMHKGTISRGVGLAYIRRVTEALRNKKERGTLNAGDERGEGLVGRFGKLFTREHPTRPAAIGWNDGVIRRITEQYPDPKRRIGHVETMMRTGEVSERDGKKLIRDACAELRNPKKPGTGLRAWIKRNFGI